MATIIIALAMYMLALLKRQLSAALIVLSLLFFAVGTPLGYDTLKYSHIVRDGVMDQYGPLWAFLGFFSNLVHAWWAVYFVTYIVVVFAFVALSQRNAWPSLLMATLTTLPGLGFDFLSVLRQGLSTAFLIMFYIALKETRKVKIFIFALFAFLAHPAALFVISTLLFIRFWKNAQQVLLLVTVSIALFYAVSIIMPQYFATEVNNIAFLLGRYLVSNHTIKDNTGDKLFFVWCLILVLPVLVRIKGRCNLLHLKRVYAVAAFLLGYSLLLAVSGSSVRLIWFFLPMLIATVISTLVCDTRRRILLPTNVFFVAICFCASAYVLMIAPEYFWVGEYPGGIHW